MPNSTVPQMTTASYALPGTSIRFIVPHSTVLVDGTRTTGTASQSVYPTVGLLSNQESAQVQLRGVDPATSASATDNGA